MQSSDESEEIVVYPDTPPWRNPRSLVLHSNASHIGDSNIVTPPIDMELGPVRSQNKLDNCGRIIDQQANDKVHAHPSKKIK
jgi:hypothetical protein